MGRQLFRTSYKHRLVNQDVVIAVMPIPAGGMLANVWGDVHLIGAANIDRDLAAVYACGGWILPHRDDSFTVDVDTFFDQQVPKDVDISQVAGTPSVDITPETAENTPFEEPGEVNANRLWNVQEAGQRIYNRERVLTIASRGLSEPVVSSEVDLWMPNDHFNIRLKDKYRVEQTSYAMFAVATPSMDDVTVNNETTMDHNEQTMLENIELAMTLSLPQVVGMTEAGAESPFATLAGFIEEWVEPTVEEETAGAFALTTYNCFARFTFEIQFGPEGRSGPIAG